MLIRDAEASVRIVRTCTILVRGSLDLPSSSLLPMWRFMMSTAGGGRLARYRLGAQAQWASLPTEVDDFAALLNRLGAGAGCRCLEVSAPEGEDGLHLELADLQPVCGEERASYIRVLFPEETASAAIAGFGEWAINELPLWWGSAGFVFHHTSGPVFTAYTRVAALAKRYWGVQIQDLTSLQWDGLGGIPSVNWLTLVGEAFAASRDVSLEQVAADAPGPPAALSHRRGRHGVVIAAGPHPLRGDINAGEDIEPYVRVATLLRPLLLTEHTPLFGPFAKPAVLNAWLGRFSEPRAWLEANISVD